MLKNIFLSEKKLLNAILRAKLKPWKCFFLMNEQFFAMQKTDFMSLSLFSEKVILELKCTKSLL